MRDTRARHALWQVPGHFYSPIPPHPDQIPESTFDRSDRIVPGIDLHPEEQAALLATLRAFYPAGALNEVPDPVAGRYYIANDQYPSGDAAGYTMMLRHLRPARILEIGSGYSTAVALDARDRHPELQASITCIEPYPERLLKLLRSPEEVTLVRERLQDVPLTRFEHLGAGDVLFVDSTHVAKLASDVNYLFEYVLPSLKAGVIVHVHDVHWPFEYPREWAEEGRAWNEAYMLRTFLQFNSDYGVKLWANYLQTVRPDLFADLPYFTRDVGSGIWLERLRA